MKSGLMTINEATQRIKSGARLIISGDDSFLAKLPKGQWIGGTSPYSMSDKGGAYLTDKAYVQELPDYVKASRTSLYSKDSIPNVYSDGFQNGFSLIMIPVFTDVLVRFALEVRTFKNFAAQPLMGWVTGTKLEELGKTPAKVYDGFTGASAADQAIVMHLELPASKYADLGTINIFDVPTSGDVMRFDSDSLVVSDVWINDKKANLAEYLLQNKTDLRWPLVGNHSGTMTNSSFMAIDEATRSVKLFAPVFKGIEYRLAQPQGDYNAYLESFRRKMPKQKVTPAVTCNCMFNYKYGDLDGKPLDELTGPFVFGEIAYLVLNQTLVYLNILDA